MEYNILINELLNLCDDNLDIRRIKELKKEILNDQELKKEIEDYHLVRTVNNKKKLYKHPSYVEYLQREIDITHLINMINGRFSCFNNKECHHEDY